ncbi:MAG: glycosyltransferase [Sneathiella sp.]
MVEPKIAIVIQHLEPGGIEYLALDFFKNFPLGDVCLISLEGNKSDLLRQWPELDAVKDRVFALNKRPGWDLSAIRRLVDVLKTFNADLVHTHHIGPLIYGGIAARISGRALVHTEHDAWHLDVSKRRNLQKVAISILKPTVVADASKVAEIFGHHMRQAVKAVIINGIDTHKFTPNVVSNPRQKFGLSEQDYVIGTAGRMVFEKNQELLIRAFAKLPGNAHKLLIAGEGELKPRLENLVQELDIKQNVTFLGHVSDMPDFYNALDVFVLPSRKEGLPLSLLEAQSCGVPVIATDVGGVKEAVCHQTGSIVPEGDVANLIQTLQAHVRRDGGLDLSRNFVLKTASQDKMFRKYDQIYRELTC